MVTKKESIVKGGGAISGRRKKWNLVKGLSLF